MQNPVDENGKLTIDSRLCVNCQVNKFEGDYPTKLCYECRQKFLKYPIPNWIMIFAGVIVVVMIIGISRMPRYFSTAIHLGRAENAMEDKRYLTAQRELLKVLEVFPDHTEANARLLIASGYLGDVSHMYPAYKAIEDKQIEDMDLFNEAQAVMTETDGYYLEDTLFNKDLESVKDSAAALMNLYARYASNNAELLHTRGMLIANQLYEIKEYKTCGELLGIIMRDRPTYFPALSLLTAVCRNTGEYDRGIEACNKILERNKEEVSAIGQKARIELKRKNDSKAAEYAQEAMEIDPENVTALEAQAMVEFFAGKKAEAKKHLQDIEKIETKQGDMKVSTRLGDIISGKVIYR